MSKVGDVIDADNARWQFGGATADRFDAHVERSVPFYHEGHDLVVRLADFFLGGGATALDLGCATGRLTARMAESRAGLGDRFLALDVEPSMTHRARQRCARFDEVLVVCGDVDALGEQTRVDFVVAYYTLQFVRPRVRQALYDRIYRMLNWGGAFVLFEKVRGPDARFQDIATALYQEYKLERGYSGEEIVAKSRSLKGVLEPFSSAGNEGLLRRAGFQDLMTVFKYVCFEGVLAIK